MREDHIIERQGKRYVLYAGLLDEFHQTLPHDTHVVDTNLIQVPNSENGMVAIVHAFTGIHDGEGKWIKRFNGIGDASPQNVTRAIAPHLIRMAETRAKARALRDLINVGEALFDDEGAEPDHAAEADAEAVMAGHRNAREAVNQETGEVLPDGRSIDDARREAGVIPRGSGSDGKARKSQVDLLTTLAVEWRGEGGPERLATHIGKPLTEMTRAEADEWIDRLTPESRV